MSRLSIRLARALLTPLTGPDEARAVVADVAELAGDRGAFGSVIYFWVAVLGFPLRIAGDSLRTSIRNLRAESNGRVGMEGLKRELAYAVRTLRRSPGFTATTVVVLALGIGAAVALSSVVRGVLLDPLPIPEPDRVVAIWMMGESGQRMRMTPGNVSDVRTLDRVFQSVAAFQGAGGALSMGDVAIHVRGGTVTPNYFATLGVEPVLGRTFTEAEGLPDGPPVVILGAGLWRRLFGGDPGIVGRTVDLDGQPYEVIGVVPAGIYPTAVNVSTQIPFTAANQEIFLPIRFSEALWDLRRPHIVGALARLRDGVDREQAAAALEVLSTQVDATNPSNAGERIVLNPLTEEVVGNVRVALYTLLGTVALVMLIVVFNVGALFALRADDRVGEMNIRLALGAPHARLIRQLLIESLLIAGAAILGGALLARAAIDWMRELVPYQIPRLETVTLDGAALIGAAGLGLVLAVAFGIVPWLRMDRHLSSGAGGGSRGATAGLARRRLQGSVVAFQACLGVVVLVGAVLLARSFSRLMAVDPGFDAWEAWVIPLSGVGDRMPEVVEHVRTLPGVRAAAMTYDHPLDRNWSDAFLIQGVPLSEGDERPGGSLRAVGEGYFEAAGLRVLHGRVPDALDLAGDLGYAVVNQALVDRYFPDGNALDAVIYVPSAARNFGEGAASFTVLGVVENVRFLGVDRPSEPAFYLPLERFPVGAGTLMVRPERADLDIVRSVSRAVREVAPGTAVHNARRLRDIRDDLLARPRFNMMLLVCLASIGLILTGLGAYGLVGRSVVSRTREIGIRMALGADRRVVARSVLAEALRPMLIGGVLGLVAAALLVRAARSLLFEVSPADPVSFLASAVFLLGVGLLAAVVPAVRAVTVNPAVTLREE